MRQAALALLALALLVPAAATVGAQTGTADATATAPDPSGLTVAVHVHGDGDAEWNVSMRYALSDRNETDAFESLLADYRNGANVGPSVDVFRSVANAASDRTGRKMTIRGVSRSGRLNRSGNATGVLSLSFTWTNFSVVSGNEVRVEDAFAGGWFGDLQADERLVVYPPDGYSLDSASPASRVVDGGALWDGPQAFDTGPSVTFTRGTTTSTSPPTGNDGVSWPLVVGAAAVALLAGGVAVFLWNNRDLPVDGDEGDGATGAAETNGGDDDSSDGGTTAATGGDAAGTAASAADGDEDETGDESGEELLSDEERVERLLRENGGRMKQAKIVEETRWSNAKVSQLLSGMADEGRVEKLRIGRENLISLPDENGE